jgi:two-component system CheB/CheR fusion protein
LQGILAKRIKDESGARLVVKLEETLGAMSGMLNTLLDINQLEAGIVRPEIAEFQVGALLERLKTEFAYHVTAKDLAFRVVTSRQKVRSDPRLLEQTLRNLLANAVKYTERGKVLLGCRRRGDKLRIEVWDTGMGIPAGQLKWVFEEFHQLDNSARERSRGLGLGLSIVQRICDLLAHTVDVRSWPGSGSVFAVELPIAGERQVVRPQIGRNETETNAGSTGAILVIEDDPAVREMLEILFEGEGHPTTAVATTNEALALAARGAILPDVIVADYNLPGDLKGTEVIARLRASLRREIPAIILTGDISSDTLREVRRAGCTHLSKPVKADVLTQQIQSFLAAAKQRPKTHANLRQAVDTAGGPQPSIFLVDDDRALLEAMEKLLREHGYAVEVYASGAAFLDARRPDGTGCLVVDSVMPGMNGIALLERLKAEGRSLPAIMITGHGDVTMAVHAMKAGAVDFLEKPVRLDELRASIDRALEGARDSAKLSAWRHAAAERLAGLTPREREIMNRVIQGQPNKIIADDLGISQRTVESHRAAVMKRTGVRSLPDLVRLVLAAG